MLDTSNKEANGHWDEAWELIPWFVNGTLSDAERDRVSHYIETCPDFAAEVARQHVLKKRVATEDTFEVPLAKNWESLQAQIRAEQRTSATPAPAHVARGNPVTRRLKDFRGAIMVSGAALAACAVAIVVILPDRTSEYTTLTEGRAVETGTIKFQTHGELGDEALKTLLTRHGLALVSGPSESGVYTASLSGQSDPATAAHDLMTAPEILFAAPDSKP